MVVSPAVSTLLENPPAVFLKSSDLLITCADNILRHPGDECPIDEESLDLLQSTRGAMECLNEEMGIKIIPRVNISSSPLYKYYLVFPRSASVEQLRLIRESIAEESYQRILRIQVRIRECIAVLEQSPPQTNPSSGQGPLVTPPALSPANTSALATSVPVPQMVGPAVSALLENPLDDFLKSILVTPPALSPANTSALARPLVMPPAPSPALATSVPVPQNGPTHYNYMEHIGNETLTMVGPPVSALLENPLDDFLKSFDLLMSPAVSDEFLKYSDLVISETRTMEFKRGLGSYSDVLSRYASAFLNTELGQLLFGVDDKGLVQGININSKQQDEIRLQVYNILKRFKPPVFPPNYTVEFLDVLPGKEIPARDTPDFKDLKVLRLTFTPPPVLRRLYQTDKGEIFLRLQASVKYNAKDIHDWYAQVWGDELEQKSREVERLRRAIREARMQLVEAY